MIILNIIEILLIVSVLAVIINMFEDYGFIKKIKFEEDTKGFGIPVIKCTQGDKDLYFIVDTGSNISTIDSNKLDSIEHTKLDTTGSVYGMEGNIMRTSYVEALFNIEDKSYQDEFQVINMGEAFETSRLQYGVNIVGILGNAFLKKFHIKLDPSKNIMY